MENRRGNKGRPPESPNRATPVIRVPISSFPVRKTLPHLAARASRCLAVLTLPFFISFFLSGCGAPGDPVPPAPTVPAAVSDLVAHQAGDGVELVFSLPAKSVAGEKLGAAPAVEIDRGSLRSDGAPDPK